MCYLFTYCQSFPNFATTRSWSVSHSAPLKLGNLVYANAISYPSICDQSGEVQVYLWIFQRGNVMLLTASFFDAAKFTFLTPLSLLSWCRLSFPVFGLKIFCLPTFALKSNRSFIWYLGKWWKTCSNSSERLSFESSHFSSLGACTFRTMILHQRPLRTICDILSLTNPTLLIDDTIPRCTKYPVPNW